MKRSYYMHRSGGKVFDYFGGVGKPFKVRWITAMVMKVLGYKVTRAPAHYDEVQVMVRAALLGGAHRRSIKVQRIKERGYDK